MSDGTKIEWTGATWNPIRARYVGGTWRDSAGQFPFWGYHCEHVSEGCRNCYAERMNGMLPAWGTGLEYTRQNREHIEIYLDEPALMQPLRWRKGRKIFPCSMTDLFADFVTDKMIDRVFAVMALTPQHTYQVLTKRAARMLAYFQDHDTERHINTEVFDIGALCGLPKRPLKLPLPNVWLGVSVEDQRTADERIPLLLRTPAALRWVSYEPALGPVDFVKLHKLDYTEDAAGAEIYPLSGLAAIPDVDWSINRLDWIVVGGESGPGGRPFDVAWARQTIRQCRNAGVPVFLKQLGADPREGNASNCRNVECTHPDCGYLRLKLKDRIKGGNPSEWPEDLRVRQYPEVKSAF